MQGPDNVMHLNNVFEADIHNNHIKNINTTNNGHMASFSFTDTEKYTVTRYRITREMQ